MHSSGRVPRQTASMSSHQVMAEKRVIIFLRDQMPCEIAMKEEACKAKISKTVLMTRSKDMASCVTNIEVTLFLCKADGIVCARSASGDGHRSGATKGTHAKVG